VAALSGAQVFLTLRRDSCLRGHEVSVHKRLDSALADWSSTTRISPLFPYSDSAFPDVSPSETWYLFFIGPVDPGNTNLDGLAAFASVGLYNVVVAATEGNRSLLHRLLEEADAQQVPWEGWQLSGTRIVDVAYCPSLLSPTVDDHLRVRSIDVASDLSGAADEYATLVAATAAKCAKYAPQLVREILEFDSELRKIVAARADDQVQQLACLVNVNAALSRFSSQTFAGTSPILQTECHFWSHSLLGVGIATQALLNIRRFYDRATELHRPAEKLRQLQQHPTKHPRLAAQSASDPVWRGSYLSLCVPTTAASLPKTPKPNELRLVVYFSGRDGFKSTQFTLSSPLEVITGCNTYAWTPLTLTHEISHVIVERFLSVLLTDILKDYAVDPVSQRLERLASCLRKNGTMPSDLLEQARQMLLVALIGIQAIKPDNSPIDPKNPTPEAIIQALRAQRNELRESLTHVIDFHYFYHKDVNHYISSLWTSWSEIPNIADKIEDYLSRSLTAVLSANLHLSTVETALDVTLDAVHEHLQNLAAPKASLPKAQTSKRAALNRAIDEITARRSVYRERLLHRIHIAKLATKFMLDEQMILELEKERGGKRGRYSRFPVNEFHPYKVHNPLAFLNHFGRDRTRDSRKSLWILHHLAFAEV
jgi:hypothetical protein